MSEDKKNRYRTLPVNMRKALSNSKYAKPKVAPNSDGKLKVSQSLRISKGEADVKRKLAFNEKNKLKFTKQMHTLEYTLKLDNIVVKAIPLEFEDAYDFLRGRYVKPRLNFKDYQKKMPKKNKNSKEQKTTPQTKTKHDVKKSMDLEDCVILARRRRNRRQQMRFNRIRALHTARIPIEKIPDRFPPSQLGEYFCVGMSQMKGKRPTMQDASYMKIERNLCIFGVFDGHVGHRAAQYCAKRLPKLIKRKMVKKDIKHIKFDKSVLEGSKKKRVVKLCIRDAFVECNEELKKNKISEGDSKMVLYRRNGELAQLTEDHDTKNVEEVKRIEKMGGKIHNGRVNGLVNVTRALGDNFSDLISRDPYTICFKVDPNRDAFIIIASDGLWNYVTTEQVIKVVASEKDPRRAAQRLRNMAFSKRSSDNISVMVMYFLNEEEMKKMEEMTKLKEENDEEKGVQSFVKVDKTDFTQ